MDEFLSKIQANYTPNSIKKRNFLYIFNVLCFCCVKCEFFILNFTSKSKFMLKIFMKKRNIIVRILL